MAIVYLLTNIENGKRYVGKTKGTLESRWYNHVKDSKNGSKYAIHRAIRKHGKDAFTRTLLGEYPTEEEALVAEREWIAKLGTMGDGGYNMCEGGRGALGYRWTPEMKESHRILALAQGRRPSPACLAAVRAVQVGAKRSPEVKARMAAAQQARRACEGPESEETKAKRRAASKATIAKRRAEGTLVASPETRAKHAVATARTSAQRTAATIAGLEDNDRPRLSAGQAAERLGISRECLRVWDNCGILRARRHPKGIRYYDLEEFDAAIKTLVRPKTGRRPYKK